MTIIVNCYDSGAQAGQVNPYCNANQGANVNTENNVQQQAQAQPQEAQQESPGIGGIFNSLLEGLGMNKMFGGVKDMLFGKSGAQETNAQGEPEGVGEPENMLGEEGIPEVGEMLGEGGGEGAGLLEEGAELLPELACCL